MKDTELSGVKSSEIELLRKISIDTFVSAFGAFNEPHNLDTFIKEERSLKCFQKEFANPQSHFFWAKIEGEIAGYMKVNEGDAQVEHYRVASMELQRTYVIEKFQNKGIGSFLISHFEKMGQQADVQMLWLGAWEKNPAAIRFYKRNGYRIFDKHTFMVGDDPQTDVLMRKFLKT